MRTQNKEQILLRFDSETATLVRNRARSANKSVNKYILSLVVKDLQKERYLPKVSLPQIPDSDLLTMAGDGNNLPTDMELAANERLDAIWKR